MADCTLCLLVGDVQCINGENIANIAFATPGWLHCDDVLKRLEKAEIGLLEIS